MCESVSSAVPALLAVVLYAGSPLLFFGLVFLARYLASGVRGVFDHEGAE